MDISKLYIPNTNKWIKYYEDLQNGKKPYANGYIGMNQNGGSIASMNATYMIPVEKHINHHNTENKPIPFKVVSPAQGVVDRAKSEVKRSVTEQTDLKKIKRRESSKKSRSKRRRLKPKVKKQKGKKSVKRKRSTDIFQ